MHHAENRAYSAGKFSQITVNLGPVHRPTEPCFLESTHFATETRLNRTSSLMSAVESRWCGFRSSQSTPPSNGGSPWHLSGRPVAGSYPPKALVSRRVLRRSLPNLRLSSARWPDCSGREPPPPDPPPDRPARCRV